MVFNIIKSITLIPLFPFILLVAFFVAEDFTEMKHYIKLFYHA